MPESVDPEQVKAKDPDVIFLAEAFTKPKVMQQLAKQGYTQSYTYFTWRESKHELISYVEELTKSEQSEYMRPNFWPNTPDILTDQLQHGGRPVFAVRAVLAATLSANWGIYGPAFELLEHRPIRPGSEEYLDRVPTRHLRPQRNLHPRLRGRVDTVGRQGHGLAEVEVGRGIAQLPTPLLPVDHGADEREGTPQQLGRRLELALGDELARAGARDARAAGVQRGRLHQLPATGHAHLAQHRFAVLVFDAVEGLVEPPPVVEARQAVDPGFLPGPTIMATLLLTARHLVVEGRHADRATVGRAASASSQTPEEVR